MGKLSKPTQGMEGIPKPKQKMGRKSEKTWGIRYQKCSDATNKRESRICTQQSTKQTGKTRSKRVEIGNERMDPNGYKTETKPQGKAEQNNQPKNKTKEELM